MNLRRTLSVSLALSASALTAARSFSIQGTAPSVRFNGIQDPNFAQYRSEFEAKMNGEVKTAFDQTLSDANAKLKGFKEQKDLARGMANANAYSSNSATLQGFQNYDLFAVSSGFLLGLQAPSLDPTAYESLAGDITDKGDLYAGVGMGLTYLNVGLNCKFLLPGLYLNAKYGGMSRGVSGFSLDFKAFGVGANYKLLEPRSFIGLVKWRGLSVGTGFYVQMDKINMRVEPDTFRTDAHLHDAVIGGSAGQDSLDKEALLAEMGYGKGQKDAQVLLSPVFDMGLDVSTYTIPLEVNTAVSVLWGLLNVNAGLGMDLNFGSAKIALEGHSDADIKGNSGKVSFDKATVNVDGGSHNGPSFARLRAMTGVGVGLGPVKIDVPILYYVKTGLAFGVTAAIVW